MRDALQVPHHQQWIDGYCLPACVQMVLAYWGIEREQAVLAKLLGTIPGVGTPGSRVHKLVPMGLAVTYAQGSLTDLQIALTHNLPPILLVYTGELPYWSLATAHAIVLCGISEDWALVNDPGIAQPMVQANVGDLLLAGDAMANLYALLQPVGQERV